MFLLLTFFLNNLFVLEQIYVSRIIVKIEQSSLYPVQSFKIFSFHPHSRPLLSASAPRVGAGPGSHGAAWGLQPKPSSVRTPAAAQHNRVGSEATETPARARSAPRSADSSPPTWLLRLRSAREAGPGGGARGDEPGEGLAPSPTSRPSSEGRFSKPKHFES